jgi:hypothetical protein
MSRIKNPKLFEIALATGGSHYPDVGGELLEKYGEAVIRECARVVSTKTGPKSALNVLEHFGLKEE